MLSHHVAVYNALKRKFPEARVVFGTSDKVKEGSPFNFKEKQAIAIAHGISPNDIISTVGSPYVHKSYPEQWMDEYYVFFAVGEKDMAERFPFNNVDPDTGLDMSVRPNKDTGDFVAKYYQKINTYNEDNQKPMGERGYIYEVPNIDDGNEVASASAFRNALKNAPDEEAAKEVFVKQFSNYKEDIFNLVYNKIVGEKMSEDLNILMKLAGLEMKEGAPVEFESAVNVHDIEFTPVSKSSSFHSIANRFPDGTDVNDPDVKKEQFIQALLKSPANLLAEINERISPSDDNGLEASEKVNKIIKKVEREDGGIAKLDDDDKKFTLELVKKAIKEMELSAGDDSPAFDDMEKNSDEESMPEESVDLSDIRSDYGIQEDEDGVYANHVTYVGPNGDKLGTEDCDSELDSDMMAQMASDEECKMLCDKHNMDYNDTVGCLKFNDGEATMQDGEELPDGTIAFYGGKEDEVNEGMTPQVWNLYQDLKRKDTAMANEFMKQYTILGGKPENIDVILQKIGYNEPVDEGRMSDIHQDATSMDKEEFAKEHPEFADDWEGMQQDKDAEDEPRDDGSPAYKKYIGKHNEAYEQLFKEFAQHLAEAEGIVTKGFKAAGAAAGTVGGGAVGGPIGGVLGAFAGMEGADAFSRALDQFLTKNKLNAPGIKTRLVNYMQRMMQSTKDTGVTALNNLKNKVFKDDVNESEPSESIRDMSDEDLMDYVGQKEEDLIDDMQQHIAPDFLHKDNYEETFEKYREEVLEPAAHDESQDAADGMEPDEDYDSEDFVDNYNMVGDDEINQDESIEEGSCPKCGESKHKLMACSSCGCNEDMQEEGSCPKCGESKHKLMACSSCGCNEDMQEEIEETTGKALDAAMAELKTLAGLNS